LRICSVIFSSTRMLSPPLSYLHILVEFTSALFDSQTDGMEPLYSPPKKFHPLFSTYSVAYPFTCDRLPYYSSGCQYCVYRQGSFSHLSSP
jgi:hypothetical protein